jgi:hypothetical protein
MAGFAQTIAETYGSATYQTAADNLRLPYLDWAAIPQTFPDLLTWPIIQINTSAGLQNVTNPLFRYTLLNHLEPGTWFPTYPNNDDTWYGEQPYMLRHADSNNISHNEAIQPIFSGGGPSLTYQVVSSSQPVFRRS